MMTRSMRKQTRGLRAFVLALCWRSVVRSCGGRGPCRACKMSSNLVAELAAAGVACSVADGIFHPLDTLKTRLHATPTNLSKVIVDAGGGLRAIICLWTSGLAATAARTLTFAATRVGAYPSVRDAMSSDASRSFWHFAR